MVGKYPLAEPGFSFGRRPKCGKTAGIIIRRRKGLILAAHLDINFRWS